MGMFSAYESETEKIAVREAVWYRTDNAMVALFAKEPLAGTLVTLLERHGIETKDIHLTVLSSGPARVKVTIDYAGNKGKENGSDNAGVLNFMLRELDIHIITDESFAMHALETRPAGRG